MNAVKIGRIIAILFWLIVVSVVASGCTKVNTFPSVARAGDTITLVVGSADGMTKANTTIVYTPNGGSPVILHDTLQGITGNLRAIFNLYPEKTAPVWFSDVNTAFIPGYSGHGPWLTVIAIDLPSSLEPGTGTIQVTTDATYPQTPYAPHVNDTPITIGILPGSGIPDPFSYYYYQGISAGNINKLQSRKKLIVAPPNTGLVGGNSVGAAVEITVNIPNLDATFNLYPDGMAELFWVIAGDTPENIFSQRAMLWRREGDNLIVDFVSPVTILQRQELRFDVVGLINHIGPGASITLARYFDENGFEILAPGWAANYSSWRTDYYNVNGT